MGEWRAVAEATAEDYPHIGRIDLRVPPEPWREHALCASWAALRDEAGHIIRQRVGRYTIEARMWEVIDAVFFGDGGGHEVSEDTVAVAKAICQRCPVRRDCLETALRTGEREGIWGGTTPEERRRIRTREEMERWLS